MRETQARRETNEKRQEWMSLKERDEDKNVIGNVCLCGVQDNVKNQRLMELKFG